MELLRINEDHRVYVIKAGAGVACYGFDVLDRKGRAVAQWLQGEPRYTGRPVLEVPEVVGTVEHFQTCAELMERGAEHNRLTGARCPAELVPELIGLEGKRVQAEYLGEVVRFKVGKSTGWMPCHLMINRRASGGDSILPGHIKNVRAI